MPHPPRYRPYTLSHLQQMPQLQRLGRDELFAMEVVGQVLPFRSNNYVVEQLIDWSRAPDDPMFRLTFPQREMLLPHHFTRVARALRRRGRGEELREAVEEIRLDLNPHPAGQMQDNVPRLDGRRLEGMQHKYRETVLFFPSRGQTCHAYCSFCFRWPQFVGMDELRFAARETDGLLRYLRRHPEVTDLLITGGDPMIMRTRVLASYIDPLLAADPQDLRTIRIGSKALAFWPYRFTTDADADDLLRLFEKVVRSGRQLAFMAHFSHPAELGTEAVRRAIARIRGTGAEIRTQSPILAGINDRPEAWNIMWREQVRLGCVPYYMFVVRNTGAQHYFGVPLAQAYRVYREAFKKVSGLCRTVRGPSMSAHPGKVEVCGVQEIGGEEVFVLRMLQGRDPDWVLRPFMARFDEDALWLDELRPAFGEERFFFEDDDPDSGEDQAGLVFDGLM